MNLTIEHPRSPNAEMAGIVSLARVVDKTKADAEGTLGEYDVDCPHDKPMLAFLGVDFATFAAKIKQLDYDDAKIEAWAKPLIEHHSAADIAAFNAARRAWGPNEQTQKFFDLFKAHVAPDRADVTTWFQLLDLDEGRAA